MSVGERSTLADIVAVGVVRRAFKSERSSADTYSAEVRLDEVLKGRQLVDGVPYRPLEHPSTSGDFTGNNLTSGVTQPQLSNMSGIVPQRQNLTYSYSYFSNLLLSSVIRRYINALFSKHN